MGHEPKPAEPSQHHRQGRWLGNGGQRHAVQKGERRQIGRDPTAGNDSTSLAAVTVKSKVSSDQPDKEPGALKPLFIVVAV